MLTNERRPCFVSKKERRPCLVSAEQEVTEPKKSPTRTEKQRNPKKSGGLGVAAD
jgi:hypothetical protein